MENRFEFIKQPKGVFVFIDDNKEEQEYFKKATKTLGLGNQLVCCFSGTEAYNYLKQTEKDTFMIICDVHMPVMDGFEFKRLVEGTPELKIKSIPFFFHSADATDLEIKTAYTLNIQGFLRKAATMEGTLLSLYYLICLWTDLVHPNELVHKFL
jgi:CheY-like chemotaxis protein